MKGLQEESSDVEKEPTTGGIIYILYKYVYLSIYLYIYYILNISCFWGIYRGCWVDFWCLFCSSGDIYIYIYL